jgi:hypothetical protein
MERERIRSVAPDENRVAIRGKGTPVEKFNASAGEHAVERKQIPAALGV